MRISVIGTGFVGLVTAVCLAKLGHDVVNVGRNREKVERIKSGKPDIYEKDLDKILKDVLKADKFNVTTDLKQAVNDSDVTMVCVGTPSKETGEQDLTDMTEVSRDLGEAIKDKKDYHTIAIKSTVLPSTTRKVILPLIKKFSNKSDGEFGLISNPEFLREGKAVFDFMNPDRIIIGGENKKSIDVVKEIYSSFKTNFIVTSFESAELAKYAMNSLLGLLISFSNEISNISELIENADVKDVLKSIHYDKRFNVNGKKSSIVSYLIAGCGFGGSCLPKDISALVEFSKKGGYKAELIEAILKINRSRARRIIENLEKELNTLNDKRVAILGLAFNPETNDVRESPAIPLINGLLVKNANIFAYDPIAIENMKKVFQENDKLKYVNSVEEAVKRSDACILVTKWNEFRNLDKIINKLQIRPVVFDGRGFLDKSEFENIGVKYITIGKKS